MLAGYAAFFGFSLLALPPPAHGSGRRTGGLRLELAAVHTTCCIRCCVAPPIRASARSTPSSPPSACCSCCRASRWWPGPATMRAYSYLSGPVDIVGAVRLQGNRLLVLIAALALAGAVFAFLRYSTAGRAMRAIAVSPRTAPLVGIDVERYSAIAFATGGALAAVAGILLSTFVPINPTIGAAYTMKALIVVVMGGIGHVLGGLVAAFILGLAETTAVLYLDPGLVTIINFTIFSVVLLWRPQGLFGGIQSGYRARIAASQGGCRARRPRAPASGAGVRQCLLAVGRRQYPHLRGARDRLGLLLRPHALRLAGGFCLLRHRRLLGCRAGVRLFLPGRRWWPRSPSRCVLSAFVGLATLRLSGMYFVIFTFGLSSLVSATVIWWEFNVAKRGGLVPLPVHHTHSHLLSAARAVRRHRGAVDGTRPQPHGFRADDLGRRRDGRAPDRHQHGGSQDRHLRRQRRGDDARRRHPRAAQLVHDRHRRLQSRDVVPDRDHGAARRRHLGVGTDAGRGAAASRSRTTCRSPFPATSASSWALSCSASCFSSRTA